MANKMLIDATHPEETRVVVLRGNRVEEFDFETAHRKQLRGNIYLAKVTRVEPSLQAAFVDYGGNRHGFLAFSEIHPDYYQIPVADRQALLEAEARAEREQESDDEESNGRRGGRRHRGRHRRHERQHARRDETIQSEPLNGEAIVAEGAPQDATEIAPGEAHPGDQPAETHSTEPARAAGLRRAARARRRGREPAGARRDRHAGRKPAARIRAVAEASAMAKSYTAEQPAANTTKTNDRRRAVRGRACGRERRARRRQRGACVCAVRSKRPGRGQDSQTDDANGHAAEAGAEEEEEVVESVGGADAMEEVPDRAPRYRRQYKIQEVIKRRQVMLVQVVKEERGTKGAALTTYLSLAGRYCVLMPNTARGGGISRKITSSDDRKKLREIAEELEVPEGMGVILRTAGAARTKQEVKRDFEYLLRQWEPVRDLTLKSTAPTLVYEEGSLVKRSIRDLYSKDIDEIIVAGDQRLPRRQGLHAHAHAEPCEEREALSRTRSRSSRATASRASSTRCSRRPCNCAPAATSSSTRPRRWSRST